MDISFIPEWLMLCKRSWKKCKARKRPSASSLCSTTDQLFGVETISRTATPGRLVADAWDGSSQESSSPILWSEHVASVWRAPGEPAGPDAHAGQACPSSNTSPCSSLPGVSLSPSRLPTECEQQGPACSMTATLDESRLRSPCLSGISRTDSAGICSPAMDINNQSVRVSRNYSSQIFQLGSAVVPQGSERRETEVRLFCFSACLAICDSERSTQVSILAPTRAPAACENQLQTTCEHDHQAQASCGRKYQPSHPDQDLEVDMSIDMEADHLSKLILSAMISRSLTHARSLLPLLCSPPTNLVATGRLAKMLCIFDVISKTCVA